MILNEMQQEIDGLVDANKSLRLLLERLMETKSETGVQRLYYMASHFNICVQKIK